MRRDNIFIVLLAVTLLSVFGLSARTHVSEAQRDARKGDYIFGESLYYYITGNDDAFFDMASYAAEESSADGFLNALKGLKQIMANHNDSVSVKSGRDLSDGYFIKNPDDSFLGLPYVRLLSSLGDIDDGVAAIERMYSAMPDDSNILLSYIQALASTGKEENIRKALELSNEYEKRFGRDISSFQRKTQLYSILGDSAAVMTEGRRLLEESPESPLSLTLVGSVYAGYQQTDSAEYFFNKAIEYDPSFAYAYIFRNHMYLTKEDTAAYVKSNMQAVREIDLPEDAKVDILQSFLSNTLVSPTYSPEAEEALSYLIETYPHNIVFREMGARYYVTTSQIDKAVDCAQFAVDLDPSDSEHRTLLIAIYQYGGNYEKAVDESLIAARLFPETIEFPLTAVSNYTLMKRYDDALRLIDTLMVGMDTLDRNHKVLLWQGKGDIYNAMDSVALASEAYENALVLDPDNALVLNNYAYSLACASENLEKALSMIERSLRIKPKDSNSLDTYAWVLFRLQRYADAKEAIDQVLEYDSEPNPEVLEHAGDIYFMAGYPEDALEFWGKSLKQNPDNKLLEKKVKNKAFYYR
ncbi:MAG: tetratricopeptide repeat protein [Paramuribaculum sp.]|nr:tetratricopeptide repeat protein [Paramuribaculum sp.]